MIPSDQVLNKQVKISLFNKEGKKINEFIMRGGMNLWVFIRKHGLPIGSACSGVGVCAACCITIKNENLNCVSPKNDFEKETLAQNSKPSHMRLACLCRVYDDLEVQADYW